LDLLVAGFGATTLLTGATREVATETTGATALEALGTADSITDEATEATEATDGTETFGKTTVTLGRGTTNVVALDQTDVDFGAGATSLLVEFG